MKTGDIVCLLRQSIIGKSTYEIVFTCDQFKLKPTQPHIVGFLPLTYNYNVKKYDLWATLSLGCDANLLVEQLLLCPAGYFRNLMLPVKAKISQESSCRYG